MTESLNTLKSPFNEPSPTITAAEGGRGMHGGEGLTPGASADSLGGVLCAQGGYGRDSAPSTLAVLR